LDKDGDDMKTLNATTVRKDWSEVIDSVVREKPAFIKRTHDSMVLADVKTLGALLSAYTYTAQKFIEDDGTVTLSLCELDLVEHGADEHDAKQKLAEAILTYAQDYYDDFLYWSSAPNRVQHIPYVFKALIIDDAQRLGDTIQCLNGKN
jgi:hypothetical protein